MPRDDIVDRLFESETLKLEQFSTETRREVRRLMRELENEFEGFVQDLVRGMVASINQELAHHVDFGGDRRADNALSRGLGSLLSQAFGSQSSGSLIGELLGVAVDTVVGNEVVTSFNPSVSSHHRRSERDRQRLSSSQLSGRLVAELGQARRNQ